MKATVTKKEFQAYLETKTPSAQIGISGNSEKCPLAKYFQTINEIKPSQVEVNGSILLNDKEGNFVKEVDLKPWMLKFINGVDALNEDNNVRISAKKALDILATC